MRKKQIIPRLIAFLLACIMICTTNEIAFANEGSNSESTARILSECLNEEEDRSSQDLVSGEIAGDITEDESEISKNDDLKKDNSLGEQTSDDLSGEDYQSGQMTGKEETQDDAGAETEKYPDEEEMLPEGQTTEQEELTGNVENQDPAEEEIEDAEEIDEQKGEEEEELPEIQYRSLVNGEWQEWKSNGEISGNADSSVDTEAVQIRINGDDKLSIEYRQWQYDADESDWSSWTEAGSTLGEKGRRLEMISCRLTGEDADKYELYYIVRVRKHGWLDWCGQEGQAGSLNSGKSIDGIRIQLLRTGEEAPGNNGESFFTAFPSVQYRSFVNNKWESWKTDGETSGNADSSADTQALRVRIAGYDKEKLGIEYRQWLYDAKRPDWSAWTGAGAALGKKGRRLEMISCRLTGKDADKYNLYYRVRVRSHGWLDWSSEEGKAGSLNAEKSIDGIQFVIREKDEAAPGKTEAPFYIVHPSVKYRSLVNGKWQNWQKNGATSGNADSSADTQAVQIRITGNKRLGIEYRQWLYDARKPAWSTWIGEGKTLGKKDRRLEMISCRLTGECADQYVLYYRVRVRKYGWLDWCREGGRAGSLKTGKSIDGIQFRILEKNETAPGETRTSYITTPPSIRYRSLVNGSWQNWMKNGDTSGYADSTADTEAVQIKVTQSKKLGIKYRQWMYDADKPGWSEWSEGGMTLGQKGRKLEMIACRLTGEDSAKYTLFYRVRIRGKGWLDWAREGGKAGSQQYGKAIDGIQLRLLKKGSAAPGKTKHPYIVGPPSVQYRSFVSEVWQEWQKDGDISGNADNTGDIDCIQVRVKGIQQVGIEYRQWMYDSDKPAWSAWTKDGKALGQKNRHLEMIACRLTGKDADKYDLYYRVRVRNWGWLDWCKEGGKAGSLNIGKSIDGIKFKLVKKNADAPGKTDTPFIQDPPILQYRTLLNGKWQEWKKGDEISGNVSSDIQAMQVRVKGDNKLNVEYRQWKYNAKEPGWDAWTKNGSTLGKKGGQLQMVMCRLSGKDASKYELYYRVRVKDYGWLDWCSENRQAGSIGYGKAISGIKFKLVKKGDKTPEKPIRAYIAKWYRRIQDPEDYRKTSMLPYRYKDNTMEVTFEQDVFKCTRVYYIHIQMKKGAYDRFNGIQSKTIDGCSLNTIINMINKDKSGKYQGLLQPIVAITGDAVYLRKEAAIRNGIVKHLEYVYDVDAVYSQESGTLLGSESIAGLTLQQAADQGIYNTFQFDWAKAGSAFVPTSNVRLWTEKTRLKKLNASGYGNPSPLRPRLYIGSSGDPGDIWIIGCDGARYKGYHGQKGILKKHGRVYYGTKADGETGGYGLNHNDMSYLLSKKGCTIGIELDGGASVGISFMGRYVNRINEIGGRGYKIRDYVTDFFYFR